MNRRIIRTSTIGQQAVARARAVAQAWGRAGRRLRGEHGMTTAEYAVGTVAAVAFAAVLLVVVKSGPVKSALTSIVVSALGT